MRCTFCATGKGGFARNLAPHEIVDQVVSLEVGLYKLRIQLTHSLKGAWFHPLSL